MKRHLGIKHLCAETGAQEKVMRDWLRRREEYYQPHPGFRIWRFSEAEAAKIVGEYKAALARYCGGGGAKENR